MESPTKYQTAKTLRGWLGATKICARVLVGRCSPRNDLRSPRFSKCRPNSKSACSSSRHWHDISFASSAITFPCPSLEIKGAAYLGILPRSEDRMRPETICMELLDTGFLSFGKKRQARTANLLHEQKPVEREGGGSKTDHRFPSAIQIQGGNQSLPWPKAAI